VPYYFGCGRLGVLVLDNRGERDVWRPNNPVLGDRQWQFVEAVVRNLGEDIDALAVVTPLPLLTASPDGVRQFVHGDRTDDIDLFREGDADGMMALFYGTETGADALKKKWGVASHQQVAELMIGDPLRLVGLSTDQIGGARDEWCHRLCRPEQERLIRTVAAARLTNRTRARPRGILFIGGDIHAGAVFELTVVRPELSAQCLVASGIAIDAGGQVGLKVDKQFDVAEGIHAELRNFVPAENFGVTQILFGGDPVINISVAHTGRVGFLQGAVDYRLLQILDRA